MVWLFVAAAVVVACFSFVLLRGAPYLPTMKPQVDQALDLLDLQPGQTLLELGCGDGKVLIAAAERGWNAVGYELNPLVAAVAWLRTRRYRGRIRVVWGDFWTKQWPVAEGIFVFLLDPFMTKLDTKITQYVGKNRKPVKLVSFAFEVPGRAMASREKGLFLYEYSAGSQEHDRSSVLES